MGDQLDNLLNEDLSKLDLIKNILNQTSLTDDIQKQIDATLNETNNTDIYSDTARFDENIITDFIKDMATDNKTLIETKNETLTTPIKRPEVNMDEIAVIVSTSVNRV